MKKTYRNIMMAMLAVVAVAFASCDTIDENERYIEAELPTEGRKVLVEEFTGQDCNNCPNGHSTMAKVKELLGEQVIVVSIHAGQMAWDPPYGLKTPEGDGYASKWNVREYPSIVINHAGGPNTEVGQWQDAIAQNMGKPANVDINLTASLSNDRKTLNVSTKLLSNCNLSATLHVWLTESGINAIQKQFDGEYDEHYIHNHIYRCAVNGVEGENVSLEANMYSDDMEHTLAVDEAWNANNLSVVAFVCDRSGVLQVEEVSFEK